MSHDTTTVETLDRHAPAALPTRRQVLEQSAKSGLALLLAGLPLGWVGAVYAADGPETPQVRIGIIALTDCASIVMAYELGLLKKYGIEATISKEASWAVIRDRLNLGENQASHILTGMPYASTMGLLGAPVKPMIIPFDSQPQRPGHHPHQRSPQQGCENAARAKTAGRAGQTGRQADELCHDLSPRDARHVDALLARLGRHQPGQRRQLDYHPAAADGGQHEGGQNGRLLRGRAVECPGYCGWHWLYRHHHAADVADHPEKALGFTAEFADKNPKTVKAILRAVLEASQYIDKLENRPHVAEVVARPQYINTQKEVILGRLLGQYDYGDGRPLEQDPYYMTFFDRHTNFPWKSHGIWWLTQFRRWGMVKEGVDYAGIANRVHRPDIFREVAQELGRGHAASGHAERNVFRWYRV